MTGSRSTMNRERRKQKRKGKSGNRLCGQKEARLFALGRYFMSFIFPLTGMGVTPSPQRLKKEKA